MVSGDRWVMVCLFLFSETPRLNYWCVICISSVNVYCLQIAIENTDISLNNVSWKDVDELQHFADNILSVNSYVSSGLMQIAITKIKFALPKADMFWMLMPLVGCWDVKLEVFQLGFI